MSSIKMNAGPSTIAPASREWIGVVHTQSHRAWPLAKLVIALLANVAWIGLLVYGLSTLF
jgi:hypothetical protein